MKTKIFIMLLISVSMVLFGIEAPMVTAQSDDAVVIVNSGKSALSKTQVQRIFSGVMKSWPDGGPVKVLLNADAGVYSSFCSRYMGSSPAAVDGMWVNEQIKSGTPVPRKVPSAVLKAMVEGSPMFIGFVKRSEAVGTVKIVE